MTTTPPDTSPPQGQPHGPGPDSGPRVGWDDVRDLGRIRRTRDKRIAGVAGGLGHHLDIDPLIVRVAFVVLSFFGGVGLLLYVAGWLLIPEEGNDWAKVALDRRSRTVALALVTGLGLVLLLSHSWWGSGFPWGILIVAGIVALVATQLPERRRRDDPGAQTVVPPQGAVPADPTAYVVPAASVSPPAYVAPPVQPRPVNPRKRGPILFWFSLALITVALGALAVVDLAGADVAPSAYPALVLALSGTILVVGAFFGRAGGLILVGLLATFATIGSTVADRWDPHRQVERPVAAADVQGSYHLDMGELVVDLTDVRDLGALDGRTIDISGGIGHLDILVPAGITVVTHSQISGPGGITTNGQDTGGVNTTVDWIHRAGSRAPTITIDADLHVGAITYSAS
ncbi:PspC domain-containing protein [Nocardioides cynanchi]|uniref:PspC domain-containing protein n=1 Tax=Nocardioides cynanchi TaxID=2558918 RepID=UPI00177C666E|nr:PspC domain-containing protein [Nocardioides cynanchi]